MVLRSIEMREIGFPIPVNKQKTVISRLRELYQDEFEIAVDGEMVWVKGDLHNRFKRARIISILSGGKHGKDV
jgi:hypothetical protein